jgi:hypothetical protein
MISLDQVPPLAEDEKAVDALAELSAPSANRGLVVDNRHLAGCFRSQTSPGRSKRADGRRRHWAIADQRMWRSGLRLGAPLRFVRPLPSLSIDLSSPDTCAVERNVLEGALETHYSGA